ncbi:hypothetical protein AB833_19455 [Chromatiales bacterium (ex Bugula neritina AB1)]|nr:hypothetical protein AB833_19455 [Chromatiales bacterium (ex Bugula neritina AB1)]
MKLKNFFDLPDTQKQPQMTNADCDKYIDDNASIDDIRSDVISAADVIFMQLYIHMTMASRKTADGGFENTYAGRAFKGEGVYPSQLRSNSHPLFDRRGYFLIDPDLGLLHMIRNKKPYFLVADLERGTENRGLAAAHLAAHRIHNYRMVENNGDFEKSKHDTISFLMSLFMHITRKLTYPYFKSDQDVLKANDFGDFVNSLECIMAFARFMHTQIPERIIMDDNGRGILDMSINPREFNWGDLAWQPSRSMGLGCAPSMAEMHHQTDPQSIIDRNINASMDSRVYCVGDVLEHPFYKDGDGMLSSVPLARNLADKPLWIGILQESSGGRFGPMGAKMMAEMIRSSFEAPYGYGLYRDNWWGDADYYDVIDALPMDGQA